MGSNVSREGTKINSSGGSSRIRISLNAENVGAVRLDFADGPLGMNVYREITLLGEPSKAPTN